MRRGSLSDAFICNTLDEKEPPASAAQHMPFYNAYSAFNRCLDPFILPKKDHLLAP